MPGVCETHGAWTVSGKKCPNCEMERVEAENFPESILRPWRERVAAVAPLWKAGMLPLAGGDVPRLTVARDGKVGAAGYQVRLSAWGDEEDAVDDVLRAAVNLDSELP